METGIYDSGVPAAAGADGAVDGFIHYARFGLAQAEVGTRPIARCLLTHGYSIGNAEIDYALHRPFGEGFGYMHAFGRLYFGKAMLEALLTSACDTVFVTLQEADATSVLELTRRTERFLRKHVCLPPSLDKPHKWSCALLGHSKGGAVAFNIARRCMERRSQLGPIGCLGLGRVYAASPTTQGNALTALIYGIKLVSEQTTGEVDPEVRYFYDLLQRLMHISVEATDETPRTWDLYGDYEPNKRNPAWFDLSPLAPMENGRPILTVNDVELRHRGWFRGRFTAATGFRQFSPQESLAMPCGTPTPRPTDMLEFMLWGRQRSVCRSMGELLPLIHAKAAERFFFSLGAKAMVDLAKRLYSEKIAEQVANRLVWDNFQTSDGMVDTTSALTTCLKSRGASKSAIGACRELANVNHAATNGTAVEAVQDIVRDFSE